jgi:predicted HTH transcriptional regulator
MSIRVAKYDGLNKIDLIQNNEYGDCSLVKATNQVLDRMEVENKTLAKITYKKRIEKRLWDKDALKEAVINAIVHNDYTSEVGPQFEFYDDRIEITSVGGLPQGMTENEFFAGRSHPRNKELMRVFRDVELVEHLGSGVPRILESYGKECFSFSENFLQMTFPAVKSITPQVTERQQKAIDYIYKNGSISNEIYQELASVSRPTATKDLQEMVESGILQQSGKTRGATYTLA